MILTGIEIQKEWHEKNITLSPFSRDNLNPNSYNFHLGNKIKVFKENRKLNFGEIELPSTGYILYPNTMYLANTLEEIGSNKYAMSLIGRSSIGRLGLFIQVSADLGHTTCSHRWTLELVATKPIKIYPLMKIGQVSFWENKGNIFPYKGQHAQFSNIQESLI